MTTLSFSLLFCFGIITQAATANPSQTPSLPPIQITTETSLTQNAQALSPSTDTPPPPSQPIEKIDPTAPTNTVALNYTPWPKEEPVLQDARALITEGKIHQAQTLIAQAAQQKKLSPKGETLLEELSFRVILDPQGPDKITYTVKRGDSLYSIARKNKCSADYIIAINNILTPSRLNIGNTLRLRPLTFSLIIDVKGKTISLLDKNVVVKKYPIVALRSQGTKTLNTTILSETGYVEQQNISSTSELFPAANKIMHLGGGYVIEGTENATAPHPGFFLKPQDCNELSLFLIPGNTAIINF